ncbi:NEAT domain-containing protein [Sporosarcina beigongshangi]|uniref:NEAT domain-containing protein n=1 Tax=Sporosarcina beigongshangi TaxID=2782538 RepID=UPI00193A5B75|nr:NEAT domain-containing protein [Sporosarcina beigongshangi]
MKKKVVLPFFIAVLASMIAAVPLSVAADLADGTYAVEYEMLQAENDSVSIANDYFEKPATVTIDNGEQFVQFTVNRSEWVKSLTVAAGDSFVDVDVVSENPEDDQRVIAFKVDGDISQPVRMQMHIVIEDMEPVYDHKYSVRLDFDEEAMQETDAPAVVVKSSESKASGAEQDKPASSKAFIYIIIIAAIAVVAIIFVRKSSSSRKTKK